VTPGRVSGSRFVGLYPRAWRERYGDELQAVLELERVGVRTRLDLLRGALDAHLHPFAPSRLPAYAAVTASAFAAVHAIALATQPVPTDWPGYLDDALPFLIASVVAMLPSLVGIWLRIGDDDGALGRLGIILALVGHVAWLVDLVAAAAHVAYGPLTAAAAAVAMTGTALLGVAVVGHGRILLGALLIAAALAGVVPPALGWPAFAAAWTGVAAVLAVEQSGRETGLGGPRVVA
jgi:hypothetical protein